jgi:hypothetical protein
LNDPDAAQVVDILKFTRDVKALNDYRDLLGLLQKINTRLENALQFYSNRAHQRTRTINQPVPPSDVKSTDETETSS